MIEQEQTQEQKAEQEQQQQIQKKIDDVKKSVSDQLDKFGTELLAHMKSVGDATKREKDLSKSTQTLHGSSSQDKAKEAK